MLSLFDSLTLFDNPTENTLRHEDTKKCKLVWENLRREIRPALALADRKVGENVCSMPLYALLLDAFFLLYFIKDEIFTFRMD